MLRRWACPRRCLSTSLARVCKIYDGWRTKMEGEKDVNKWGSNTWRLSTNHPNKARFIVLGSKLGEHASTPACPPESNRADLLETIYETRPRIIVAVITFNGICETVFLYVFIVIVTKGRTEERYYRVSGLSLERRRSRAFAASARERKREKRYELKVIVDE